MLPDTREYTKMKQVATKTDVHTSEVLSGQITGLTSCEHNI